MSFRKTQAITINQKDYRESSQILTFYTQDFGKIILLARGIKRPKHRSLSPADLFSYSEIIFLERLQSINLLTEITIKDNFLSLRSDLSKLTQIFYIIEFLNELTDFNEPNQPLFNLALETIRLISRASIPLAEIYIFSFEAQALKELGFMPNTFACGVCAKSFPQADHQARWVRPTKEVGNERIKFSFRDGYIICRSCDPTHQDELGSIEVSPGVMKLMSLLSRSDRVFSPNIDRLKISKTMRSELRNFINKYIIYITGNELNSPSGIVKCND